MSNRLSPEKAKAIAAEYLTNGLQKVNALLAIGYSVNYANHVGLKLFDNEQVKEAITQLQAKIAIKTDITAESVINRINSVANRCLQEEPVLDHDGNETGEYQFDSSGANKALELLGKYLGIFRELAPNTEKEATLRNRMAEEGRRLAEKAAKERLDELSQEPTAEQGQEVIDKIMKENNV